MTEPVRLARRVTELVGCSRAEAEQYIRNGWVRVDGEVVESPQHRVGDEQVLIDSEARLEAVEPATLLLHKPAGFDAIHGPEPALSLITAQSRWAHDPSGVRPLQRHLHRLAPLVPLEREASGLMVFTQDGRVRRRLTEDARLIEHEYLVEVDAAPSPYEAGRIAAALERNARDLSSCKVSWQNENRLRFALKGVREGQLQAMCADVGLRVAAIRRLRIGRIGLGKGPEGAMPPGAWRYLPVGERF